MHLDACTPAREANFPRMLTNIVLGRIVHLLIILKKAAVEDARAALMCSKV